MHARRVMIWRNDPDTLRNFYHHDPKSWESFWDEYRRVYFVDPSLPPVFAWANGKPVAFVRFARREATSARRRACDVSINLRPDMRGQGLGGGVLTKMQDFLRGLGIDEIHAEVRLGNVASQRAFERAGFRGMGEDDHLVDASGEVCRIVRFVRHMTPTHWDSGGVYVIAEAGSNWRMGTPERDLAMAKALIDVAVAAGADAVKFQTYRPETVYVPNAGQSDYLAEAGIKQDIRKIFADLAMPYEMIPELADYCAKQHIDFMSTPFSPADFAAIDPHVTSHKIASYEISHVRLIEAIADSGKPTIMSTGASAHADIRWAVDTFRERSAAPLCLMQCTAKYPAPIDSMNLAVLPELARRYGVAVGLSDHSRSPITAPVSAAALGASVIEKHFTLDNRLPGPDHAFALTPEELSDMITAVREAEMMRGSGLKVVHQAESELAKFARRGLQATQPIAAGDLLMEGRNIDILRPGQRSLGAHPRHLPVIEGRVATRDIALGDGVRLEDTAMESSMSGGSTDTGAGSETFLKNQHEKHGIKLPKLNGFATIIDL
ncbi:MAG: GNAT family N-acetyltransferase [Deltaproteobacteria bacterium]|nr:GNAT family N-acetyltransferase [Deltaproteobacteria bacterium]MCB9490102.1 GNAT family N-acetyltransferase [Deltaproteobacteria bacterium]